MKIRRQTALYFAAAAVMTFILLGGGWGSNKFLFGIDTFTLHLPFFIFARKVWVLYHELPFWMPDIFIGMPAIDSANLMYFYPTNLLFILLPLPVEQAYVMDLIIHMGVAGLGMFLLLKRHKICAQAAFFGAFIYMFSGPLVTCAYNGHWPDIKALALAPFVLYFMNRGVTEKRFFFFLTSGLFMALQFLGLGMQVGAYTYIAAFIYAVYLLYGKKADKGEILSCFAMFAATAVAAALFSAPQFFPSMDYMKFSWRKVFTFGDFTEFSFPPFETITLLLPQFFGLKDQMYWGELKGMAITCYCGLMPFLFLPFAFYSKKHKNDATFFLCLGILFAVMAYGGYTPLYRLLYYLPVFNKFRNPARIMSMMPIALSFLAAAGLNSLISEEQEAGDKERNRKAVILAAKWAGAAAVIIILLVINENALKGIISGLFAVNRGRAYDVTMPLGADVALAALIRQDAMYFILISGLFLSLVYLRNSGRLKSLTAFVLLLLCLHFADVCRIERQFISYRTIQEVAQDNPVASYIKNSKGIFRSADLNFAWYQNRSMYYGLEFLMGFHAIITDKMYRLLSMDAYKDINILRLFNVRYYLSSGTPEEYKRWGLEKVIDGRVRLFEDKKYMPRAFFSSRIIEMKNDDEILSYMLSPGFDPREVLVKDAIKTSDNKIKEESSTEITEYTPNRIKIRVKTNKEGVLVLSNMYYHKWKVRIDDKQAEIHNVDYALSGVKIGPGIHELYFYFSGAEMYLCILLSIFAFILYAGLLIYEKKRIK